MPSFFHTPDRLIRQALKDAGRLQLGSTPSGEVLSDALNRLADIIYMLQTKGLKLWLNSIESFPTIAAQAGYTFGPADDTPSDKRMRVIEGWRVGSEDERTPLIGLSWNEYYNNEWIFGRPIATVGDSTTDLEGDYWLSGIDGFTHLLLPTAALMLISVAGYVRYSRASLLEVLNQDYIRTARAKGLNERTVIMRHAFRNSLIPLTTIMAFDFAGVLGGAIITERVFAWRGMGTVFNNGLAAYDLNMVMGVVLITSIAALLFNLIADLVYAGLDPRIRVTK
jgi:peptide/nickel transport system permease protein